MTDAAVRFPPGLSRPAAMEDPMTLTRMIAVLSLRRRRATEALDVFRAFADALERRTGKSPLSPKVRVAAEAGGVRR